MLNKNAHIIESDLTSNILKEGWLSKRSRLLKKWRRRWFVLTPTALYTFKHEKVYKKPTEVIPLVDFTRVRSAGDEVNEEFVFKIETKKRSFYVVSNCASGKDAWIRALGQAMIPLNLEVSFDKSQGQGIMYWITEFIKFEFGHRTHECSIPNDYSSLLALLAQVYKEILGNSFSLEYTNRNKSFSIRNQQDFLALQDTGRNLITIQIKLAPRNHMHDIRNQMTVDSKWEANDESDNIPIIINNGNSAYTSSLMYNMTYDSSHNKNIGSNRNYVSSVYKVKQPENKRNIFEQGNSVYQNGADKSPLSAVYGSNEEELKDQSTHTSMKMNWYLDIGNTIKNKSNEFAKKAKGLISPNSSRNKPLSYGYSEKRS